MSSSLLGKAPKGYEAFSTFNPQQMQLFQQLMAGLGPLAGQAQGYLGNLLSGSPEAFQSFEAPFKRQFQEEIVPGLAERFSGLGAGAQRSSAFQNALGQAGAGLTERLAQLRSGLQHDAAGQTLGLGQGMLGLNTTGISPKQQPWWQSLLLGLSPGLGQAAGLGGLGALSKIPGLNFIQKLFGG
jgi:hypothetical protein